MPLLGIQSGGGWWSVYVHVLTFWSIYSAMKSIMMSIKQHLWSMIWENFKLSLIAFLIA
jgi:hypothetical protein